jgi:hypothetical protein
VRFRRPSNYCDINISWSGKDSGLRRYSYVCSFDFATELFCRRKSLLDCMKSDCKIGTHSIAQHLTRIRFNPGWDIYGDFVATRLIDYLNSFENGLTQFPSDTGPEKCINNYVRVRFG